MRVGAGLRTWTFSGWRARTASGTWSTPVPASCVGGNVATNAGGPHVFKYGVTGRQVLALVVGATLRLLPAREAALPLVAAYGDLASGAARAGGLGIGVLGDLGESEGTEVHDLRYTLGTRNRACEWPRS